MLRMTVMTPAKRSSRVQSTVGRLVGVALVTASAIVSPKIALAQLSLPAMEPSTDSPQSIPTERAPGVSSAGLLESGRATSNRIIDESSLQSRLQELAGNLRGSGPHAVSSRLGEKTIAMIRMLPKADPDARDAILHRLQLLAQDGTPEAVTFLGFAAEQGAFGVPRQPDKAAILYRAAAQSGYQPAVYDLALMNAYGRGMPRDLREAEALLARAVAAGAEGSNRVCGMASFVAYRLNDQAGLRNYSEGCNGPLPALAIAAVNPAPGDGNLVNRLKNSIATGVDDGYMALEAVTRRNAANDTGFSYCLWSLVNRFRAQPTSPAITIAAARCVDSVALPGSRVASLEPQARQQAAIGIAHLVGTQVQDLAAARKGNSFHYGMAVPYLPFTQDDVDLFASTVGSPAQH
jgi:hypothetical protein